MSAMFASISKCNVEGRENQSIASSFNGTLLLSKTSFPYFMVVALEAGGPLRALLLLLLSPVIRLTELFSVAGSVQIMAFVAMAGLKVADVKGVAKSVLPKFYLEDLHAQVYKVFSSCGGKKYVITSSPRIMVEAFLKEYLDIDYVVGTELRSFRGYCLGLVVPSGVMSGVQKMRALKVIDEGIDVGLGGMPEDYPFMLLCREGYLVSRGDKGSALRRKDYPKPLIFHDGRLVANPTPFNFLAVIIWLPLGFILAIARLLIGLALPYRLRLLGAAALGFRIRANIPSCQACVHHVPRTCTSITHHTYNTNTSCTCDTNVYRTSGTLYVCSHRTLIDPVIVSVALQRHVTAVTYSLSRISEVLSPIRTVRLSRDREKDGQRMRALLTQGDLVVCPEGTTCREPYLLRFSPLFAEIAPVIVPVAINTSSTIFHGTTARGYKWLDSFFFLMNPWPDYRLEFLEASNDCACIETKKPSYEVANRIQKAIARVLGFECTNLTRRDKYRMLAGNDGIESKG